MAIGDTTARPKGGTAEYRSAWHHAQQPKEFYMKAREHGRGAYADTPLRFVSIEKMKEALEALSQFFDKHLQVHAIAAENARVGASNDRMRSQSSRFARRMAGHGGRGRKNC